MDLSPVVFPKSALPRSRGLAVLAILLLTSASVVAQTVPPDSVSIEDAPKTPVHQDAQPAESSMADEMATEEATTPEGEEEQELNEAAAD